MNHMRQMRILPPDAIVFPATVVGAGGIGSPTVLMLAKMGFRDLTCIDPDAIEDHNVPNHLLWGPDDAGKAKVEVTRERVRQLTGTLIRAYQGSFPSENLPALRGIAVSGVDSMASRRRIWGAVKWNIDIPLYIDGRTGVGATGQWLEVHTVRPSCVEDIEFYEQHLPRDVDADASLACDAFLPVNMAIAALIGSQVQKWIMREGWWQRLVFDLKTLTLVRQEERRESIS